MESLIWLLNYEDEKMLQRLSVLVDKSNFDYTGKDLLTRDFTIKNKSPEMSAFILKYYPKLDPS